MNLSKRLGELRFAHDHPAARAAQRFMRGGRHKVRIRDGGRIKPRGNESRIMRDVGHVESAYLVADRPEPGPVEHAGVGGGADADQFWASVDRESFRLVVIHQLGVLKNIKAHHLKILAGKIERMAMGEMASMREIQTHDRVAGVEHGKYTAILAELPECGWTFTCSAPKSFLARSIARFSAISTCSQPP